MEVWLRGGLSKEHVGLLRVAGPQGWPSSKPCWGTARKVQQLVTFAEHTQPFGFGEMPAEGAFENKTAL